MVARDLSGKSPITDYARLRRVPRSAPVHTKTFSVAAPVVSSARADLTRVLGATLPDVVATAVTWTPTNPAPGDHIVFTVTIKNQGAVATPAGVIVDALFYVFDSLGTQSGGRAWSDNNSTSLAAGASRDQTANGGDTSGYVVAGPAGNYTVQVQVNGNNRFTESDRSNNFLTMAFAVGSSTATVPGIPQNLTASPGDSVVSLSWGPPTSDGGATLIGYKLYRNNVLLTSPTAATINYDDATVVNGTTYTYTISAVNSVGEGTKTGGVTATPFASTGAPALPANTVVGAPANKVLWWGGFDSVNAFKGDFDRWKTIGIAGYNSSSSQPTQNIVATIAGSGQQVFDTAQAGLAQTSNNGWQRAWEGAAASGITGAAAGEFYYRKTYDPSFEAYLGAYVSRSPHDSIQPPFGAMTSPAPAPAARQGSWWNDSYWTTAAAWYGMLGRAMKNVYGGSGIAMDPEPSNWTPYDSAHTNDEHYQKTFDRGYQCGTAFFQNFPDGKVFVYQWIISGGWGDWLRGWYYDGDTAPSPATNTMSWYLGWCKAMCDFGSPQSRFTLMDRDFYQFGEGGMTGGVDGRSGKLKMLNERAMAVLSQEYPYGVGQTSWSRGCDQILLCPCSWADSGGSEKPNATTPTNWQTQITIDREWAMAPYRVVYQGPGMGNTPVQAGAGKGPDAGFYSAGSSGTIYCHMTTHLAANQAGADATAVPTVVPTCTNLTWTGSTLTCRAAHKYGVKYVKVYNGNGFNPSNPEASYLGAMQMVEQHPSLIDYVGTPGNQPGMGSSWTGHAPTATTMVDSYQQCTFTTAGTTSDWRVLKVVTAKDDVAWFRVQHA